ncbi:hypothetical protein H257_18468 [Aphanomyces astaci]|uniref:DDE Tnp4 domain-containing protein n=1 Tax=Aphanomyces astaci TaxID=112090 RepID=W4FB15_APHAT|nr:hypothetical protein H257_18468 [Aphanomyces astaci]ETV64690.1 hypothetical protein H257_18468 [Aphanomyces astaci]|eukprot:XP_009845825.1 hypothetical protein H257_18468 [Aphanomyces astaci]
MDQAWEILGFHQSPARPKGSTANRQPNLPRDSEAAHARIYRDYFGPNPIYGEAKFRRRFRMARPLFERIMDGVAMRDEYFLQRDDATGKHGLSPLQKCVAALRMLCYGLAADAVDEYVKIGESTALMSFKLSSTNLGQRTNASLLQWTCNVAITLNAERGFPGMFGSLDCTHLQWAKCPVAFQGQYQDRRGDKSIIMEAVAGPDLWVWHSYIGLPGSNNDINVLDRSPLIEKIIGGVAPHCSYVVNGHAYTMSYLLVDGIYPNWPTFMKTIAQPQGEKR